MKRSRFSEEKIIEVLLERSMPELTGEAVVLRHKEHFEAEVVSAAHLRLEVAGVDVERLPVP